MNKKLKTWITLGFAAGMVIWWAILIVLGIRNHLVNYWWQAFMAVAAILFGVFGLMSAAGWRWFKSSMGRSVMAMAIGIIMWGLGQIVWTMVVINNPDDQTANGHLLDVLYSSAMVFWAYGIIMLARASGAKYGLRTVKNKLVMAAIILVLWVISYYVLVDVVRGGLEYFQPNNETFWDKFFDLSYAGGDVVNISLAAVIFVSSWKYLGGIFKKPVIVILAAFPILYIADTWYSIRDAQNVYFNGDWTDLLFMLTVSAFGLGLCLLDASELRKGIKQSATLATAPESPTPPAQPTASLPESNSPDPVAAKDGTEPQVTNSTPDTSSMVPSGQPPVSTTQPAISPAVPAAESKPDDVRITVPVQSPDAATTSMDTKG